MALWIPPRTWVTGEVVTPDAFNDQVSDNALALYHLKVRQTADLVKTSDTTFADLPGLTFGLLAGEAWLFLVASFFNTNGTADAKWTVQSKNVNGTGADDIVYGHYGVWNDGVPTSQQWNDEYHGTPGAGERVNVLTAINTTHMALLWGVARALVDSTLQVQAAQDTSSGTATTFYENSVLTAFRMDV